MTEPEKVRTNTFLLQSSHYKYKRIRDGEWGAKGSQMSKKLPIFLHKQSSNAQSLIKTSTQSKGSLQKYSEFKKSAKNNSPRVVDHSRNFEFTNSSKQEVFGDGQAMTSRVPKGVPVKILN